MSNPTNPAAWYEARAVTLADSYEAVAPERLHGWLDGLLPAARSLVLDVGAGSGRDAAWLAGLGHDRVAVEPSPALRAEAARRHPGLGVRWVADQLPALPAMLRLGLAFDVILLSAVWQHVAPAERARALRKLLSLLRPGGLLALTLRESPPLPCVRVRQRRSVACTRCRSPSWMASPAGRVRWWCAPTPWTTMQARAPPSTVPSRLPALCTPVWPLALRRLCMPRLELLAHPPDAHGRWRAGRRVREKQSLGAAAEGSARSQRGARAEEKRNQNGSQEGVSIHQCTCSAQEAAVHSLAA